MAGKHAGVRPQKVRVFLFCITAREPNDAEARKYLQQSVVSSSGEMESRRTIPKNNLREVMESLGKFYSNMPDPEGKFEYVEVEAKIAPSVPAVQNRHVIELDGSPKPPPNQYGANQSSCQSIATNHSANQYINSRSDFNSNNSYDNIQNTSSFANGTFKSVDQFKSSYNFDDDSQSGYATDIQPIRSNGCSKRKDETSIEVFDIDDDEPVPHECDEASKDVDYDLLFDDEYDKFDDDYDKPAVSNVIVPKKTWSSTTQATLPATQWTTNCDDRLFKGHTFAHSSKLQNTFRDTFQLEFFRENQLEAINAAMAGHDCFILMPTGTLPILPHQIVIAFYLNI